MGEWLKTKMPVFIAILLAFAVISAALISSRQHQGCGYQICESKYTLDNGYSFTNIQVYSMENKDLEAKINEGLNSCFFILSNTWFGEGKTRQAKVFIHCKTSRYLRVEYIWEYITADYEYWHLCVTVDMQNGDLICLDDLIDVNEEFAMLVKNGENLRKSANDFLEETAEEATQKRNEQVSKEDIAVTLSFLDVLLRNIYMVITIEKIIIE